jgi:hypothetical protein
MYLDKTYSGQLEVLKIVSKSIKTPEDEKIQKRVGIIKTEFDYTDGDLTRFVDDNTIPNNRFYNTLSWTEERTGTYELNINDLVFPVKIIKIERKNKEDAAKFSLTFETEELVNLSTLGMYVKDKENPSQIKLSILED